MSKLNHLQEKRIRDLASDIDELQKGIEENNKKIADLMEHNKEMQEEIDELNTKRDSITGC